MSRRLEVRPFVPADLPRVVELAQVALGEGSVPRTVEYWRWKHLESPFGSSLGLLAERGGDLVGMRLFLRWRLRAGGSDVDAVRAVDTATHPAWQGRGIFRRLTEDLVAKTAEEGVALVFNTPNRASRSGYLKMGWRDVGRVPVRLGAPAPGRLARSLVRASRGEASETGPQDAERLGTVEQLLAVPELPDLLASWAARETRLHTPRTLSYLRWRYAAAPGLRYHAAWSFGGGADAAVILRLRHRGAFRETALCEILESPGPEGREAAGRLVRSAVRAAGGDYAAAVAVGGTPEAGALGRAGLARLPLPSPRFTVRRLEASAPADMSRWAGWRLGLGDLELM